ncbi:MAG: ATP-binding protein [Ktedonobacteraceae bacterium]|nr:ATP-binding protein [Ktedonobacteraceae bacterium]
MKVTIQNLGVIQKAEIDLRPLTIFIGPNNAGKTWLAYTLSGIFGSRGWNEYAQAYAEGKLPRVYPPLDNAIEKVLKQGDATIDLYKFAEEYGEMYFNTVAGFARHWMGEFMSTQLALFDNMDVSISLADAKAEFWEHIEKYSLQTSVARGLLSIRKKQGDKILYIYTLTEDEEAITERLPPEEIRERLVRSVARTLHQSLYPQIRVFPTERTALVTFRFSDRTREKESLTFDKKTLEAFEAFGKALRQLEELSRLSISTMLEQNARAAIGPVGSFSTMMASTFRIGLKEKEKRQQDAKNNANIQKYIQLAQVLEKQILEGDVDFSTPEPDPRREILFQPAQEVMLEIPIASSMVKELSPLVLYLRYLAKPGELLIIDEPEMNLHPEAQVKIIEFLAMLVNAGLNVLITTHSPYMLDHLSNLIKAGKYEKEERVSLASQFFLKRPDAFISQENVAIYLVDHGEAENILKEGKINWGTFGDVSDRVANIHYDL